MTKSAVQIRICQECETELPEIAEFCFNCGSEVPAGLPVAAAEVSDVWLKKEIVEDEHTGDKRLQEEKKEKKSRSSARIRSKKPRSREIEIRWEEKDGVPSPLFLGAAVLLVLISALIYLAAIYLG